MTPNPSKKERQFPGESLVNLASRNRLVKTILSHSHVLQIVDDHRFMWCEAKTVKERISIEKRLRKQLILAGVNFVGLEISIHGAVYLFTSPYHGGSLMLLGVVVMYLTSRKG